MGTLTQVGTAAAIAVSLVVAGCSNTAADHQASIMDVLANPSSSAQPKPAPPTAVPLGTAVSAEGATVTPRADNLALTHQTHGEEEELGIEVSLTGVTAPIDVASYNAGLRLYTSTGQEIRTSAATVLTMPPLPATVRTDADGWVFFHFSPAAHPSQLRLTASTYRDPQQVFAIWTMPDTLPPAAPAPPAPAQQQPDPGTTGSGGGGVNSDGGGAHPHRKPRFCRLTHLC